MPAIYAHDTFGRIVYKELEGDIHWMVHKYQEYFRIGLQGPDFLFFYHPLKKNSIREYGNRLHEELAAGFLSGPGRSSRIGARTRRTALISWA